MSRAHKIFGVALAVFLVGAFVVVGVALGIGPPSVPEGDVAVVEDVAGGDITQADFDHALDQQAIRQGLQEAPPPDDPQYETLLQAAMSDLLLTRWVRGEAADRGIVASDREIDQELDQVVQQQFGSQSAFQRFLDQQSFSQAEARERIELQILSDRIQKEVADTPASVSQDEVQGFYDSNIDQFTQPASVDVRQIANKDGAQVEQAKQALEADDSDASWNKVARKYSTDEATKTLGGLRQQVVEGQDDPTLSDQIFSAPEGELVGPFPVGNLFYLIQVTKITPEEVTPFEDVEGDIRKSLLGGIRQQATQQFQTSFISTWQARSICAEDYRIDRCSNPPPLPSVCDEKTAEKQGCEAPVTSRPVVNPGNATVFPGQPVPALYQGPQPPPPAGGGALPPGTVPLGPGGAPTTAPPGTAPPPGTVPPG